MKQVLIIGITLLCGSSFAQRIIREQYDPHIGYIYPAGAQRGSVTTLTVGGQYLDDADRVMISGDGVRVRVVGYDRPLNAREALQMGNNLKEVREEAGLKSGERLSREALRKFRERTRASIEDIRKMQDFAKIRRDPKVQEHAAVAEKVRVKIEIDPDAALGRRELRIFRDGRISNPLAIYIGDYPERTEADKAAVEHTLPIVLNGQIMPGETDSWAFEASKNDRLIVAAAARELIPHLADAVPGWFQAVISLYDSDGNELAYADDYKFKPDPLLSFKIPADGIYTLKIRDSLYRGRQDFVYRITLGEIPFVISVFPLGGKSGEKTTVKLDGENLRKTKINMGDESRLSTLSGTPLAVSVPFAHSSATELLESEGDQPMPVELGCVINGKINAPGDRDAFAIQLAKGAKLLAEVTARRLNSPLDSVLMITDESGKQLAFNNDFEDRSLGRVTHHADARILFSAPESGVYQIHLGDIQNGGGDEYAYRLQLARPQPDYALRMAPSNLNGEPGTSIPFTVYALRENGFNGEIKLALQNDIKGLRLDGARIPAGQDKVELTVTLPEAPLTAPESLAIEGLAKIKGKSIRRLAVPAEDMMQAFIYHHLIPAEELFLSNVKSRYPSRQQAECTTNGTLLLRRGKTSTLAFNASTWFGRNSVGLKIEPRNVPAGVSIENVTAANGLIEITLFTDASAERGVEGNLVFDQFVERKWIGQSQNGKLETARIASGALPAVPFRIR